MELRQLRYFVVLAEELHFSRAARRLSISQPPLSVAIRQLEEQLQAQLFERNSKEVRLTPAGAHLWVQARELLDHARRAAQDTRAIAHGMEGTLRLGFVGSSMYRGLPEALDSFRSSHPRVRIDMLELNSAEQVLGLQQARLDLGLMHTMQTPPGLQAQVLISEPFMACLAATHALASRPVIEAQDLAGERMILFSSQVSPDYYQRISQICVSAGFTPDLRHEVRHWLSVLSLVSLGQGVSLVPACLRRVGMPGLAFVPLAGSHPPSELQAMWHNAHAQPLVAQLVRCIEQSLADIHAPQPTAASLQDSQRPAPADAAA